MVLAENLKEGYTDAENFNKVLYSVDSHDLLSNSESPIKNDEKCIPSAENKRSAPELSNKSTTNNLLIHNLNLNKQRRESKAVRLKVVVNNPCVSLI